MKRIIDAAMLASILQAIEFRDAELTSLAWRMMLRLDAETDEEIKRVFEVRDGLSCILSDVRATLLAAKLDAPGVVASSFCLSLEVVASPSTTPEPSPSSSSS